MLADLRDFCLEPWESSARLCIQNNTDCALENVDAHVTRVTEEGGQFCEGCSVAGRDVPSRKTLTLEFRKRAELFQRGEKIQAVLVFSVAAPAGGRSEFLIVHVVSGLHDKSMELAVEKSQPPENDLVGMSEAQCGMRKDLRLVNLASIGASSARPLRKRELGSMGLLLSTSISVRADRTTEFWLTVDGGQGQPDLIGLQKPLARPEGDKPVPTPTKPPLQEGKAKGTGQMKPEDAVLTLFDFRPALPEGKVGVEGKGQLEPGDAVLALFDFLEPRVSSQSVALGDRGTVVQRRADGRIVVNFPCKRLLACLSRELFRAEAELPGGVRPGDLVTATIDFKWLNLGRSLKVGETGIVKGPHPEEGHVRCCFPNNCDVGLPPEHFRLYSGPDVLPGGFVVGQSVSLVVDRLSQGGRRLQRFDRATVLGLAQAPAAEEPKRGRQVRCRFSEDLEEDVPISQICGILPGELRAGDRVACRSDLPGGGDEGVVCGQSNPGGCRGSHVLVQFEGECRNLEHPMLRRVSQAAA